MLHRGNWYLTSLAGKDERLDQQAFNRGTEPPGISSFAPRTAEGGGVPCKFFAAVSLQNKKIKPTHYAV
jgi:hypothetical protein